jgi:Big-like domain-containing protein
MKNHTAVLIVESMACTLVLLGCGAGNGPLFVETNQAPFAAEPDSGPAPVTDPPQPAREPLPRLPSEALPPGRLPSSSEGPAVSAPVAMSPEARPTLPSVVSVSPPDGASAVASDAVLVLVFSVPMDRELTEGAYQSEGIPSDAVTFSWNEQSTELTITPNQPLEYASGTNPDNVEARRYSFFLSASAADSTGQRLASPAEFSFSMLREIEATLLAVQDRDLTGSWRSNDTYGAGDCARAQINTCVGDTRVAGDDEQYKGFITFDLSELPSELEQISAARLDFEITGRSGNPFAGLGALFLEHLSFEVIGPEAFQVPPLADLGRIATAGNAGTTLSVDVSLAVESDAASRARTQYRLRFEDVTDGDATSDAILSTWDTQRLTVSYLIP